MYEFVHLPGARETRLVEDLEAFAFVVRLLATRQMPLPRARGDAGFRKLLCPAGRGREPFDQVAFAVRRDELPTRRSSF